MNISITAFTCFTWITNVVNTLNPTISNSSCNHFITKQNYNFNDAEIDCDSDKTCSVLCDVETQSLDAIMQQIVLLIVTI